MYDYFPIQNARDAGRPWRGVNVVNVGIIVVIVVIADIVRPAAIPWVGGNKNAAAAVVAAADDDDDDDATEKNVFEAFSAKYDAEYPVNALRNIAWDAATTDLVVLLDVDFV